jgi:S1-C subfamily serine protease
MVDKGYLLTAAHVVQDRTQWLVGPNAAGRWVAATVVKMDRTGDLALLKVPLDAPALALSPSSEVPIGLEVSVIGFPQPRFQGLTRKITQGIVNGVQRPNEQERDAGFFQISAEVSRGNSGGPVLAPDGTVIAMVLRKLDSARVAQQTQDMPINVNYALRSSALIRFLEDSPARAAVRPLQVGTVLRPYEVFMRAGPSVLSIIGRDAPAAAAASGAPPADLHVPPN